MRNWDKYAACKGLPVQGFFPDGGSYSRVAKRICTDVCPVRKLCLEAAMREEEGSTERFGLRGGLTARERKRLAREMRKAS